MTRTASAHCVHHWILSLPEHDVVKGRCKRCGARREYPASIEGVSRMGIYDEAASLSRSISLLPDGGSGLPGHGPKW